MFHREVAQRTFSERHKKTVSLVAYNNYDLTSHAVFLFSHFLPLYCPNGISPMGNLGCLPQRKAAVAVALPNLVFMLGVLVFP